MGKYAYSLWLVVEADNDEQADEIVDKIVNADLPKEVSDKIEHFSYEFEADYDEE